MAEHERHIRLGLTEDELEIYDLLCKEKMTKNEEKKVRLAAKALLGQLTEESPKVLVQDWFKFRMDLLKTSPMKKPQALAFHDKVKSRMPGKIMDALAFKICRLAQCIQFSLLIDTGLQSKESILL